MQGIQGFSQHICSCICVRIMTCDCVCIKTCICVCIMNFICVCIRGCICFCIMFFLFVGMKERYYNQVQGIQGYIQRIWSCICVCINTHICVRIMNCIFVCIMTCICVCTGSFKETDFYRSVYLQIEFPICHKQLLTENLAACDREGIQSANPRFGKTQFF